MDDGVVAMADVSALTDQELLRACRAGGAGGAHAALAELVRRHADWVYSAARRRVRDPGMAEDVAQATFIVLATKARGLMPDTVLEPWLLRVTSYTASAALRAARRRRRHEQGAAAMREETVPGSFDSAEAQLWLKLEPVLDDLVEELPAKDREAVLLRFYRRKSYPEIAAALATTEEAARKRVDRATERLRVALHRRGLSVTAGVLGAVLVSNVTRAATAEFTAGAVAAALATAGGGLAVGGAGVALAQQAAAALLWAKVTAVGTAAAAGVLVTAGVVAVTIAVTGGADGRGAAGGAGSATAAAGSASAGASASTGTTPAPPAQPAPAGAFDAVARPYVDDSTGQTPAPVERAATAPATPLAQQAVPAPDPALAALPIAPGWPLALPGEVTTSITVADIAGDAAPEIILPVRRRNAQQPLVHPEPNWATQLFAFTAAGATVERFPIQLVEPIETPNPRGFWSSSPSVYIDAADGKARLVLTLPLAKGACVVQPGGALARMAKGNPSMNVPLADVDRDGAPDLIGGGLLTNVLGGTVAGWDVERLLGGYGTSIADVDGDGSLEVFRPSYPFNDRNALAELGGFNRAGHAFGDWPATIPGPCYFPPVFADVSGDAKREVIAACGDHLFAWTHDGKPAPGTSPRGSLAAVLKDVTAWQSSPALADVDGDGRAEVFVFDQATRTLRAWHGDGRPVAGGSADGVVAQLPAQCAGVAVVDLGGDGVIDCFTGAFWVKWDRKAGGGSGGGGGSEPARVTNMIAGDGEVNFVTPTVADTDGDGTMEVLFGLRDGRVFVYRTGMTCAATDMHWPTANGSFAHTGAWPPVPPPVLRPRAAAVK